MKKVILFVVVTLILIVIIALVPILFLGAGLGLGWVLTQFSSFTLFEASILAMLSLGFSLVVWQRLFTSKSLSKRRAEQQDDFDEAFQQWLDRDFEIPPTCFYETDEEKTWEAWVRYEMANSVYHEFEDAPYSIIRLGEQQLQELAIRLTDVSIEVIKERAIRNDHLRVTITTLKEALIKDGQRPYDDEILRLGVQGVNNQLNDREVIEVVEEQLWDKPCELFD